MPAFLVLAFLMSSVVAQAHTTGRQHIHMSCPGEEHCQVVTTGHEQLPTGEVSKPKAPSDKEH